MNTKYKCEICSEIHEDYPALTFPQPDTYYLLNDEEKNNLKIHIDSDFCTIDFPDGTERYIRAVLRQKIIDSELTLDYGVWVSLSEKSYEDYIINFDNENHETCYFGWLNSTIAGYDMSESIPTDVKTKLGNERPEIIPHLDNEHPFVKDYYEGISKQEAEKRVHEMLSKFSN